MTDTTTDLAGVVLAVDCDRTLTGPDLVPDGEALDAIARLRQRGARCILVTGRPKAHFEAYPRVAAAFDAYAFEGGAVWGSWNEPTMPSNAKVALQAAERAAEGGLEIQRRTASFSAHASDEARIRQVAAECSIQVNIDRLDILPPGLDKGTGLDGALATLGSRGAYVVAIGDAANDLPLLVRADLGLAVANAVPALKAAADEVLGVPGPAAVVEAAGRLLQGDWRPPAGGV